MFYREKKNVFNYINYFFIYAKFYNNETFKNFLLYYQCRYMKKLSTIPFFLKYKIIYFV